MRKNFSKPLRNYSLVIPIFILSSLLFATCVSLKKQKWSDPREFNHELSAFPLKGTHDRIPCESCHVAGQYRETPKRCQHCHAENIAHASDPLSECQICHSSTITWLPHTFEHDWTSFRLRDSHAIDDCFACHAQNTFSGLKANCITCHANSDVHNGTRGSNCSVCHNAKNWKDQTFNHATTGFPLDGKHSTIDCESCHGDGGFSQLTKNCSGCHGKDRPVNHFGENCETCHSTTTWKGAIFVHTFFPIDRGDHRNLDCQECHTVPNNFREFSCISGGCHTRAKMDREHQGEVSGYIYESRSCYRCHPTGTENDD